MMRPATMLPFTIAFSVAGIARAGDPSPLASSGCTAPAYKTWSPPEYPQQPVWRGLPRRTMVYLTLTVDKDGNVTGVDLDKTRKTTAHADLQHAAMIAAKKWTFTPSLCNGKPSGFEMNVPVLFGGVS